MVGFDHDDRSAFARQLAFAMSLPVCVFNVSVLVAPTATPLYAAMRAQGRLVSDQLSSQFPSANLITNLVPALMSREDLYIGAKWLISKIMTPANFLLRLEAMIQLLAPPPWSERGLTKRDGRAGAAKLFSRVLRGMMRSDEHVAHVVRRVFTLIRERPELRDSIGDAFSHYLMTLQSYQVNGVYDRELADLDAPPFDQTAASSWRADLPAYA